MSSSSTRSVVLRGALLLGAAIATGSAASGRVVDKIGGLTPGQSIRCTYQVTSGSNSNVFDANATVDPAGNATFTKATGILNWVYYYNNTTNKMLSALDPTGDGNLWDSIHVGDRYALFGGSDGTLATIIATDVYVQNPSIIVGQVFSFSNGVCAALPGATVFMDGVAFTGQAPVSGFNEVQNAPAPGSLALLGLAGLFAARRRRARSL